MFLGLLMQLGAAKHTVLAAQARSLRIYNQNLALREINLISSTVKSDQHNALIPSPHVSFPTELDAIRHIHVTAVMHESRFYH
jgi:hypothetical protein